MRFYRSAPCYQGTGPISLEGNKHPLKFASLLRIEKVEEMLSAASFVNVRTEVGPYYVSRSPVTPFCYWSRILGAFLDCPSNRLSRSRKFTRLETAENWRSDKKESHDAFQCTSTSDIELN
uniref:Uncharacterized protein n=1 Tax=Trichuris muris TaxID=70415 RepID=A0A5S6QEH7_TRIMR